ncbi:carboxypeptidase-like regulatory domain-containing protein [Psychroserpens sp. BH13MA-6]
MKNQPLLSYLCLLFLLAFGTTMGQSGIVSGTLTSETDGLPLPGLSIIVKGTSLGTQTDFDGNYSIKCQVGDTLVYSYIGMKTREVRVTSAMFGIDTNINFIEQIPVETVENKAYAEALRLRSNSIINIPSLNQSKHTYKQNSHRFNEIKLIRITEDTVHFKYHNPYVYLEAGYKYAFGVQFFKQANRPKLQKTYAQGASLDGSLMFLGPDTNTPFSYGPKVNTLEFDGTNYPYDINGSLVPLGSGNGQRANSYDNDLLDTSINHSNNVFVNISTDKLLFGLDFTNTISKDVFDREQRKRNEITLSFKHNDASSPISNWNAFITYGSSADSRPNINGFINNVLLNTWATPASFSNRQGIRLSNMSQRQFNSNYNNPLWLLQNTRNRESHQFLNTSLQNKIDFSKYTSLDGMLSYSRTTMQQDFGQVTNTVGFENGYLSHKAIKTNTINAIARFKTQNDNSSDNYLTYKAIADWSLEHLDYNLEESMGFDAFSFHNPSFSTDRMLQMQRHSLRLLNKVDMEFDNAHIGVSIGNNSYVTSIQKNAWILPFISLDVDIEDLFNINAFNELSLKMSTNFDVKEPALYYDNQSHNSLQLLPSDSQSYTANNDLFINQALSLEKKRHYTLGLTSRFYAFNSSINLGVSYYTSETDDSVFPVYENNRYLLKNVADIRNRGLELALNTTIYLGNNIRYSPKLVFSTYRTKVIRLIDDTDRIPIAGFSNVSKNLIVGEPAGVIMGSAFARDNQNNLIIDDQGYPVVDNQIRVIGDPTPDFNVGFTNSFYWKNLKLSVVVDIQKGGDVWNGTQNTLNYLGRSQQSAKERAITNYIYEGVDVNGLQNTIPVDFYNPENPVTDNRFVRYGFSGVGEEAIVDGSYINLKTIDLSYKFEFNYSKHIRELGVGIYANNLATWTNYEGASPYSSLFDTNSGQGLNFFNLPIASEVGFKLNLKI